MQPSCFGTSLGSLRAAGLCTLLASGRLAGACTLPSGQSLSIRLAQPVSSYSAHPGDLLHAVLTQDLVCGNTLIAPLGSPLAGTVRARHRVGLGFAHETASLDLDFSRITLNDGTTLPLHARVDNVENARESVRNGVIHGIRSTDTFQGLYNSRLYHLPTWNPFAFPALLLFKTAFPIFPEPEIFLPAGTDLDLRTTEPLAAPPHLIPAVAIIPQPEPEAVPQALLEDLTTPLPWRVSTRKDRDADILNLAFLGSEDLVREAFTAAAWNTADPLSNRAVARNLYALLNNSGYTREPMTTFFLDGRPQSMSWQRSLNSYNRRDHLRLWHVPSADASATPLWLGSSTQDTTAVLALRQHGFVHHIAPDLDRERSTVLRDLTFAGCVRSVRFLPRPGVPVLSRNSTGDLMRTDGDLAVVELQPCHSAFAEPGLPSARAATFRPGNLAFRFLRRQILTLRSDLFRANPIYGAWSIGRSAFLTLHRPAPALSSPEPPIHRPAPALLPAQQLTRPTPVIPTGVPTFQLTAAPTLPPAIYTLAAAHSPVTPVPAVPALD